MRNFFDRRNYKRIPKFLEAEYELKNGTTYQCQINDISAQGILMVNKDPLNIGDNIMLNINNEHIIPTRVVRTDGILTGIHFDFKISDKKLNNILTI